LLILLSMLSKPTRFCLSAISFGIREEMPFDQRKKLQVANLCSIFLTCSWTIRLTLQLMSGNWKVVPFDAVFLLAALVGLTLLLLKAWQAAITVLVVTCMVMFTAVGWFFHNGMEDFLLVVILASTLLLDTRWLRHLAFGICAAAFVTVKLHFFVPFPGAAHSRSLFAANMAALIFAYGWFLQVLHEIYDNYRREVDRKNSDLHKANLAKEKLLSIIAHDLRAPIGNLKGALDGLDTGLLTAHQFDVLRHDLQQGVDHVHASMENLLIWATGHLQSMEPDFQPVPLRAAAARCVNLLSGLAEKKRIAIENRIPLAAVVRADPDQLGTIFRNLLANAVKFTPEGGRIEIEGEREESGQWRLWVRDTGIGMSEERARRLFSSTPPRSTAGTQQEKGLGLGLSLCREFVERNHGTIWVESSPGKGTAIYFTLEAVAAMEPLDGAQAPLAGKRPARISGQG